MRARVLATQIPPQLQLIGGTLLLTMLLIGWTTFLAAATYTLRAEGVTFWPLVLSIGLFLPMIILVTPANLEVGVDGLLLTWFGRPRFFSYREFTQANVSEGPKHLDLSLVGNGGSERLLVLRHAVPSTDKENALREIIEHVREYLSAAHKVASPERVSSILSGASVAELLAHLESPSTYRAGGLSRDELWNVARESNAHSLIRLRALLALRSMESEAVKQVAAEIRATVVRPEMRAALAGLADGVPDSELIQLVADLIEPAAPTPTAAN